MLASCSLASSALLAAALLGPELIQGKKVIMVAPGLGHLAATNVEDMDDFDLQLLAARFWPSCAPSATFTT